jgi:Ca2+/H+ antiporter
MNRPVENSKEEITKDQPPSLWQSIVLLIIFTFGVVILFGAMVYLLLSGAEQLGLPFSFHVAIFVVVSGVFAWLLKRITDIGSSMSRHWFPEDDDR